MALATLLWSPSVRADEPAAPQAVKLSPEIQAMLSQLLKAVDDDTSDNSKPTTPSPTEQKVKAATQTTSLSTGSLRTGGLASPSLGGHGIVSGIPRLTNEQWRDLFPLRK
jgi:predicted methyltransferase